MWEAINDRSVYMVSPQLLVGVWADTISLLLIVSVDMPRLRVSECVLAGSQELLVRAVGASLVAVRCLAARLTGVI